MTGRWVTFLLAVAVLVAGLAAPVQAGPVQDLGQAGAHVQVAMRQAQAGDIAGARAAYEAFRQSWLEVEDGIKGQSKTAYREIEAKMGDVQIVFLKEPVDQARLLTALTALDQANQKFITGGYPADGGTGQAGTTGNVKALLALLDQAAARAEAGDAPGAAAAMDQFRQGWLDVEGLVLTQSARVYADAERDMVDAYSYFTASPPQLQQGIATVHRMQEYLEGVAGKSSYSMLDAASIILREGLEALLVIVALLGFLKKAGQAAKGVWVWSGVGAGLIVSALLAVAVKLLVGAGAFGDNNFLIAGWTGLFAAGMLIWVSYWLHSKASVSEWNRYIRDKSTAALATGNLFSLATLAFLAIFREGTETVLFYIGMASSITLPDLLLGIGLGFLVLAVLAFAMLRIGLKIPMRPFFLVSSVLVFYLAFKFTGMGIHGLQLAGVLPATVAPYLPHFDFLALYPNWQSTLPQLLLLGVAIFLVIRSRVKDARAEMTR